jgi:hypothetical protein
MGQNFNRSEPSLKDIVQDQLRINSEVGKKLLANDKIMESIDSKMNNFTTVVQNQLSFNKVLETRIAQLAASLWHPNGGDFPGHPAIPIMENVKGVITRSRKTMAKTREKSKKMSQTDPVEEEKKAEAEVEVELRPGMEEEEDLGKASPKDINDTHLLPFPCLWNDTVLLSLMVFLIRWVIQVFQPSLVWLAPRRLIKPSVISEQAWVSCQR